MIGDVCDAAAARYSPKQVQAQRMLHDGEDVDSLLQGTQVMRQICDKDAVLAAIGCDRRIGSLCLRPGYGFGGPCFPRDNRAFATVAFDLGVEPVLPRATDACNSAHAHSQVELMVAARQQQYTFCDVAYKPRCPTPLIEESQKLRVASLLATRLSKQLGPIPRITIADRAAVLQEVRLVYGQKFSYLERS